MTGIPWASLNLQSWGLSIGAITILPAHAGIANASTIITASLYAATVTIATARRGKG